MEIHGSLTLVDFLAVDVDLRQKTSIILEAPFLEFIMEKSMRKRESSTSGLKENKKSSPFPQTSDTFIPGLSPSSEGIEQG
jgi:hypothetical protein